VITGVLHEADRMTEEGDHGFNAIRGYGERLEEAEDFRGVWEMVKDSVKDVLAQYRVGIMLFLDDLPLRLGAYHPVGTNNIVLNRALLDVVEGVTRNQVDVNAFVYSILLHEYLHAIGYLREAEVRPLVLKISRACFGSDHVVTQLARLGPWSLLQGIPLEGVQAPKRVMEIVKDLENDSQEYIA
jgi:hypothetical protein